LLQKSRSALPFEVYVNWLCQKLKINLYISDIREANKFSVLKAKFKVMSIKANPFVHKFIARLSQATV